MPIFMVERQFAEQIEMTLESADGLNALNDEAGVRWLHSFLSADLRKTYCLYEASSAAAIVAAAQRAGIPADAIVELTGLLDNSGVVHPIVEHDSSAASA